MSEVAGRDGAPGRGSPDPSGSKQVAPYRRRPKRPSAVPLLFVVFTTLAVAAMLSGGVSSCVVDEGFPGLDGGPGTSTGTGVCIGATCPDQCAQHPVPGCACSTEGQDLLCGTIDATYPDGTHVCGKGVSVCNDGVWGTCVINQAVTLVPNVPPGFYTEGLGTGSTCLNNPCDPSCIDFVDTPGGLTDGGITGTDAGVTLTGDGGNVCVPKTCAGVGANCGPVSDTCGGLLQCGTCPTGQSCGGGGPSQCGYGTACTGLCTQQVVCPNGGTTSISGTVYEPNGVIPLPNAVVYVPLQPLAAFTTGVECDSSASCLAGSGNPLVTTTTAYDGSFTLTNMPVGTNIPLVMQVGRFRREVMIPNVAKCVNTNLASVNPSPCLANATTCSSAGQCCSNSCSASNGVNPVCDPLTRLPKNKGEGDIPKMAFVTGQVDGLECVWRAIGIDDAEFTVPSGNGRINLYAGNFAPGAYITNYTATPNESALIGSPSTLSNYDIVLFPCQGGQFNWDNYGTGLQAQYENNLANYVNEGGRVFTTHYSYIYLISDCLPGTTACTTGSQCCSGTCTNGACTTPMGCGIDGVACTANSGCCSGVCTAGVCAPAPTCVAAGGACSSSSQCCAGDSCVSSKCTSCATTGASCTASSACCSNSCTGTSPNKKCAGTLPTYTSPVFSTCTTNANCADNSCTNGLCCYPSGTFCSASNQCCGGSCNGGSCCGNEGAVCATTADCCAGTCGPNGFCVNNYASPLSPAMLWSINGTNPTPDPGTGYISQSFAKGVELSEWLQFVNASSTLGQITINTLRNDFTGVVPPTQLWMTTANGTPMEATFNTPLGAAATAQCGRVVHSEFHVLNESNTQYPFPQECPSISAPTPSCTAVGGTCSSSLNCCSQDCSGGVCISAACAANGAACSAASGCCSGVCTAGACVAAPSCLATGATCSTTTQCCGGEKCTGSKCAACGASGTSCTTGSQCCTGSCTGATGSKTCTAQAATCAGSFAACTQNSGCCGGACNSGVCCLGGGGGCSKNSQCCDGSCINGSCGALPSSTCATSADCSGGGTCANGKCCTSVGNTCVQNSDCCNGSCAGNVCCGNVGAACTTNSNCCGGTCTDGFCTIMDPQELLLANMLFDLASCITPDVVPPCMPISCNAQGLDCGMAGDGCGNTINCGTCASPTTCGGGGEPGVCGTPLTFTQATFTRIYNATTTCPAGSGPVWRDFSYVAVTPTTSQISFTIQTAPTLAGLAMAPVETLVFSPTPGPPTMALLNQPVVASTALASDTGSTSPDYTLVLNNQIRNNYYLQVNAILTPSSDMLHAPTLLSWDMQIDCAPNQ